MNSLDEKELRRMSCADLRKCAKEHGVKANMKAEKIIAALLELSFDESFTTQENKILNSSKKNKINMFIKDKEIAFDTPRRGTYTVEDEDSFVVLERQILNSHKKNKEKLFDEDKKIPSDTPRRETYTVDDSINNIKYDNASVIETSASPELKKRTENGTPFVTKTRGSEKKTVSKRKVSFMTPVRRSARLSAATPMYNSVKDRPKTPMPAKPSTLVKNDEKDSIVGSLNLDGSVNIDSKLSNSVNVKRPSTPMPNSKQKRRVSLLDRSENTAAHCLSIPEISDLDQLKEEDADVEEMKSSSVVKVATPMAEISPLKKASRMIAEIRKVTSSRKKPLASTPLFKKIIASSKKASPRSSVKTSTPGFKLNATNSSRQTPRSSVKTATPGLKLKASTSSRQTPSSSIKTSTPGLVLSARSNSKQTPNFAKIHEKAFDKLESLDVYQTRKLNNYTKKVKEQLKYRTPMKSSIPKKVGLKKQLPETFGGIRFVPSDFSTKNTRKNVAELKSTSALLLKKEKAAVKSKAGKAGKPALKENSTQKRKNKFDLKASLAKKLPYKPHIGPLRPLGEGNLNRTLNNTSLASIKTPAVENSTVKASRMQNREVLRGVRKNKRFLLQMNNRNLNMSSL